MSSCSNKSSCSWLCSLVQNTAWPTGMQKVTTALSSTKRPLALLMTAGATTGNSTVRFAGHEHSEVSGLDWTQSGESSSCSSSNEVMKAEAEVRPNVSGVEQRPTTTSPWPQDKDDGDDDDEVVKDESSREMLTELISAGQTQVSAMEGYSAWQLLPHSGRRATTAST